jgi:hypothetical protein
MKKIAILLVVLGLLLACVPVAFADDSDPTTGEITITGTAATVATSAFILAGHTLDGTDLGNSNQLLVPFAPGGIVGGLNAGKNGSWVVTDPRGTGAGYTIDVKATDFTAVSGPGSLETPAATIPLVGVGNHFGVPLFQLYLPSTGIVWVDGQFSAACNATGVCGSTDGDLMPTTVDFSAGFTALTDTDQSFVLADPDEGMGTYYLNPQFDLFVPAETYAGRYTSTVTLTLTASAP